MSSPNPHVEALIPSEMILEMGLLEVMESWGYDEIGTLIRGWRHQWSFSAMSGYKKKMVA